MELKPYGIMQRIGPQKKSGNTCREPLRTGKDVFTLFGYGSVNAFNTAVAAGRFPKPDVVAQTRSGNNTHYWLLSTINKELSSRSKINKGDTCD